MPEPGRGAGIAGIRTVAIPVVDHDRAMRFYTEVLGFEVRMDLPARGSNGRWVELGLRGAATTVALSAASDAAPAGGTTGIRLTGPDAGETHRILAAAGADVGELLRWPGVPPMFEFRDPDGNGVVLVEDRP